MKMSIDRLKVSAVSVTLAMALAGCSVGTSSPPPRTERQPQGRPTATRPLDQRQVERLKQVMVPLLQNMDRPIPLNKVSVGIIDDAQINAANAGGGEFYVTTGLLARASDEQLRGVMAHEVAHADLGHVAKTQTLGTGVGVGVLLGTIIMDQVLPGSGQLANAAGQVIGRGVVSAYSRKEEYEADAHGVAILKRAGFDGKQTMVNTLSWLQQSSGSGGGGFFATHPATGDRIQAVRDLR